MEAAGNKEADGSVSYTETDYGYYFVENTKVTVTATDGSKEGDSGVKEIHYYTVDANGTKSSEQIVQADAEGKVTFVVQAGFKGQIYACAYDMLNNREERYVTPSSLSLKQPSSMPVRNILILTRRQLQARMQREMNCMKKM